MIIFLVFTIFVLVGTIVYLNVAFYNEKKVFKKRIETLQRIIAEITAKQTLQQGKLQLSAEMDQTLKSVKAALNHDILGLNHEMFDLLSKNNLLKK